MSQPRPRTVTLASVYAIFASAFLLFICLNLASNWTSLEVRQQLEETFAQIPAAADFNVEDFLPLLRWVATVGAVLSLAAIVFAVFVMRGHRGARIGLTVLCVMGIVAFVSGGVAGLLPAMLAAIVLSLLWSSSSRAWFAAVNNAEPLTLGAGPAVPDRHPNRASDFQGPQDRGHSVPSTPSSDAPVSGAAPAPPPYPPLPGPQSPVAQGLATHTSAAPPAMPRALVIALSITGIGSVLALAITSLLLFAVVVMRDEMLEAMRTQDGLREQVAATGLDENALLTITLVAAAVWWVTALIGLIAIGVAFTRRPFAWWLLLFVCILTAGVSILAFPFGLLVVVAAVVVVVLLSRADVRAWFRSARQPSGHSGYSGPIA